jgi:hypothetical protein
MISDLVLQLEKENDAYKKTIRNCILLDDEYFIKNIEYFKIVGLNQTLSYCPFPDYCKYFETCRDTRCDCDTCDNGYPR